MKVTEDLEEKHEVAELSGISTMIDEISGVRISPEGRDGRHATAYRSARDASEL